MPDHALSERSVILVTLDSCRYDTAVKAATPHLDRLGPLLEAESPGTYTLPAHAALFNGFLPRPVSSPLVLNRRKVGAIWRSVAARPSTLPTVVPFEAPTLMEHYRQHGHRVLGAGGVSFFDSTNPANGLPQLFPEFHYFGNQEAGRTSRVRNRSEELALHHGGLLANLCAQAPFFLFVNCASTHIPYTTPASPLTPQVSELVHRLYRLHDTKSRGGEQETLSGAQVDALLAMQQRALEWADARLGELFEALRRYEPLVVVCADHGEEFGEGGRFGHGHAHPTVSRVPLWCGMLEVGS